MLALWMAQCPGVMAWFAEMIGRPVDGLRDAEEYWRAYAEKTSPQLKPVYLTSGRTSVWQQILAKKAVGASLVPVIGESRLEILLTLAAELQEKAPVGIKAAEWKTLRNQCLFVDSDDALARCRNGQFWIAVPTYLYPDISGQDSPFIVLALSWFDLLARKYTERDDVVKLPWRRQYESIQALMDMGIEAEQAIYLAEEIHGNFPALLRKLTRNPSKQLPAWLKEEEQTDCLIPLLLAGAWEGDCEGDLAAIAELAGKRYESYIRELQAFSHREDAAVFQVENFYSGIALSELWQLWGDRISTDQWKRFERCALHILSGEEKRPACSEILRRGIAVSLVRMGTQELARSGGYPAQICRHIVSLVIGRMQTLAQWRRMSDVLEILAEAAPEPCLKKWQENVKDLKSPIWQIDGSVLLQVMDKWLWERKCARPALDLMLMMAENHPERQIRERACRHLARIFWLWDPQGAFTMEEREELACQIIGRNPDMGRRLVQEAAIRWMPPAEIGRPRWRRLSWTADGPRDRQRVNHMRRQVFRAYLAAIRPTAADWEIFFQGRPSDIPMADILDTLEAQIIQMPDTEQLALGKVMAYDLSWRRQYPEVSYQISEELMARMERVLSMLLPDTPARFIHCFDTGYRGIRPEPILRTGTPPEQFQQAMSNFHAAQLRALIRQYGEDALYEIAPQVEETGALAQAILDVLGHPLKPQVLVRLQAADRECAVALLIQLYRSQGLKTCQDIMAVFSPEEQGEMLTNLPLDEEVIHWVRTAAGREEQDFFWAHVSLRNFCFRPMSCIENCLPDLLTHRRSDDLIRSQSLMLVRDGLLAARVLQAFLKDHPGDEAAIEALPQEAVQELFAMIYETQRISDQWLARLEWAFLPAHSTRCSPRGLSRLILHHPAFYMRLLAGIYGDDEGRQLTEESDYAIKRIVAVLLHIRHCPGETSDDSIDAEAMRRWIRTADELAGQWGYGEIHRDYLGRMLAWAPAGTDGLWPAEPIRDWLEEQTDSVVIHAMAAGRWNQRGAHWDSAGREERKLARDYQEAADTLCIRWPRTAEMLREIASMYSQDAAFDEARARKQL